MTNGQGNCRWVAVMIGAISMMLAAAIAAPGQNFVTLHSFAYTDGAQPEAALLQAADGRLYGTTAWGGTCTLITGGCGSVFKVTTGGNLTSLFSFDVSNGETPIGRLVRSNDGNFYGTTQEGGNPDYGTVFRMTANGTLTTIWFFCHFVDCADGIAPSSGLAQGSDGNFYGTIPSGEYENGNVYKITPSGTLTVLYTFCQKIGCADGLDPYASLTEGTDGNFYGTTSTGGTNASGTVFKITPSGTLTTLYSFCSQSNCSDGAAPYAPVIEGSDGNFYGTTSADGANGGGGTVFKLTPSGMLTTLYSFCSQPNCTDGYNPYMAGLVQGTDGNLYGVTASGGTSLDWGTVFRIAPDGSGFTTIHDFTGSSDGGSPDAGLMQDTNGDFYGTTNLGANGYGTVFGFSVGLGPFVEPEPALGKVGKSVLILGTDLTGATSVTFNGTPATYTVASATAIKTTVPTGATTGPVQVVTPNGTLTSNVNFEVLP